jgi:hypothetical protein
MSRFTEVKMVTKSLDEVSVGFDLHFLVRLARRRDSHASSQNPRNHKIAVGDVNFCQLISVNPAERACGWIWERSLGLAHQGDDG